MEDAEPKYNLTELAASHGIAVAKALLASDLSKKDRKAIKAHEAQVIDLMTQDYVVKGMLTEETAGKFKKAYRAGLAAQLKQPDAFIDVKVRGDNG